MTELTCFKAHDIGGEIGVNIDEGFGTRRQDAVSSSIAARKKKIKTLTGLQHCRLMMPPNHRETGNRKIQKASHHE